MTIEIKKDICPFCFSPLGAKGVCPLCKNRPNARRTPRAPKALPVGTKLKSRYVLGDVIGEGGFGITYIAFDGMKEERVAVKEYFPSSIASRSGNEVTVPPDSRARFLTGKKRFTDEAKNMAAIKGMEGIPAARDYFSENGTAYIVMEYICGDTLKSMVCGKGRLSEKDAVNLLVPVLRSLALIHGAGIIHRDVSADNVIVTDGGAKLIDFGASVASRGQSGSQLKRGYAPPEQYEKGAEADGRTDEYAAAATLYFCLTGNVPQEATERMRIDKLSFPARLSPRVTAALTRALSLKKEDRYPDMPSFIRALTEE